MLDAASANFERGTKMMFMVVETFRNQDGKAIYRRLREKGRMMPDGLKFGGLMSYGADVSTHTA